MVSKWAIGIDIGGTFTDIVAVNYEAGELQSLKVLTTHGDPASGVSDGVRQLMSVHRIDARQVVRVVHATTLFTNALIERRGAKTAMIVTRGFRDVIEIGHERKYDLYDLNIEAAPPLVPRDLREELGGRMDGNGIEVESVDKEELRLVVESLVERGIESIAVCLLHSYANDTHEKLIGDWISDNHPQISVTLSSQVAPVVREFERISTTAANAYVKPLASRYLDALEVRLSELGIGSGLLMMLSNGGLAHIDEAKRSPIQLLESGPAAGAISAAHYSLRDSQPNLLAFDMGGTTAKLCLVENGTPSISFGFEAARQKRFAEGSGLPIRITTIDLIEIGAGGGSIAYKDKLGLLKVGPESAGSEPGPACYDLGGTKPTVTDANLILGYLNPDFFAGGTIGIDVSLAQKALGTASVELDRELIDVAWGIHDIVAENMAGAARVHVAERGRDPRDFVMLCTGGGGPVHSYYVAQKIGVRTIICPPAAGVASAYGLLVASARADRSRTVTFSPDHDALPELEAQFVALEAQSLAALNSLADNFGPVKLTRFAEGRFAGQGFNLSVQLPDGPYSNATMSEEGIFAIRSALKDAFLSGYRDKFGRTPPDVPIELVNLRVAGEAPPREQFKGSPLREDADALPKAWRNVYFSEIKNYVRTAVYDRASINAGFKAVGPLVIEDPSSSLIVGPLGYVEQLATGNLIITIRDKQA